MTTDLFHYQAKIFSPISHIRHGFFTRRGGASQGVYQSLNNGLGSKDERQQVLENRARVCKTFDMPSSALHTPYQIHSSEVTLLEAGLSHEKMPRCDGLVTDKPGLLLGILTADCAPVLFVDEKCAIIGAAHAGWRGALEGVLENTLVKMQTLGARAENIRVAIGPTISQENYQVGAEFFERFVNSDSRNARFFIASARQKHYQFNLPGYIIARLSAAGVGGVENLDLCTYKYHDDFYSYRRSQHKGETDYGRLISVITLI